MSVDDPKTQVETFGHELFDDVRQNVQGVLSREKTKNKEGWIPLRSIDPLSHYKAVHKKKIFFAFMTEE
jgi:hypothetical protein